MPRASVRWFFVAFAVVATLVLMSVGVSAGVLDQDNNGTEPEVIFTFSGLGEEDDWLPPGDIEFTINTRVIDENGAIDKDTPLRYKVKVLKGGVPLANQPIKYGTDYPDTFYTDEDGVAWFGPGVGFTLNTLPALLDEDGVTTSFQVDLGPGEYYIELSLVDITVGNRATLGTAADHTFVVYWPVTVEFALTGLEDGTVAGDCNFSITSAVNYEENEVLDEVPVKYWIGLSKGDEWLGEHEFKFADGENWETVENYELFGPGSGITLKDLKGEDVTTLFQTVLTPGSYELAVALIDVENDVWLGVGWWEFTINEAPAPEEPKPEEPKPEEPKPEEPKPEEPKKPEDKPKSDLPRTSGGLPYLIIPGLFMLPAGLLLIRKKGLQGR